MAVYVHNSIGFSEGTPGSSTFIPDVRTYGMPGTMQAHIRLNRSTLSIPAAAGLAIGDMLVVKEVTLEQTVLNSLRLSWLATGVEITNPLGIQFMVSAHPGKSPNTALADWQNQLISPISTVGAAGGARVRSKGNVSCSHAQTANTLAQTHIEPHAIHPAAMAGGNPDPNDDEGTGWIELLSRPWRSSRHNKLALQPAVPGNIGTIDNINRCLPIVRGGTVTLAQMLRESYYNVYTNGAILIGRTADNTGAVVIDSNDAGTSNWNTSYIKYITTPNTDGTDRKWYLCLDIESAHDVAQTNNIDLMLNVDYQTIPASGNAVSDGICDISTR